MKDFLLGILILAILLAVFSRVDTRVEFGYPYGNWYIYGDSGDPIPGEGEQGDVDVFSFGKSKDKPVPQPVPGDETTTSEYCPITVEVVTKEKTKSKNLTPIQNVLYRIFVVIAMMTIVVTIIDIVLIINYVSSNKPKRRTG